MPRKSPGSWFTRVLESAGVFGWMKRAEIAALRDLRPGRAISRVDGRTYAVAPGPESTYEVWQLLPKRRLDSEVWFELGLGPQPRVRGHAELVGPLLDAGLATAPKGRRVVLFGRWFGWLLDPTTPVPAELSRPADLFEALLEGRVDPARAQPVLERGSPILRALVMLSDPAHYEGSPEAAAVRPAWRWLARDGELSDEARHRSVRMLAHCAEPSEVVARLDDLSDRRTDGALGARIAAHLSSRAPHLRRAARTLQARIGTSGALTVVEGPAGALSAPEDPR